MKLAEFQSKLLQPKKDRGGGVLKYHYADLPSVLFAIREVGGVGVSQPFDIGESVVVRTVITGIDELEGTESRFVVPEWFFEVPVYNNKPSMTKAQAFGSGISYARRYALSAMLGIVGVDEDDDRSELAAYAEQQSKAIPKAKQAISELSTAPQQTQQTQQPQPPASRAAFDLVTEIQSAKISNDQNVVAKRIGVIRELVKRVDPSDFDMLVVEASRLELGDGARAIVMDIDARSPIGPQTVESIASWGINTQPVMVTYRSAIVQATAGAIGDVTAIEKLQTHAARLSLSPRTMAMLSSRADSLRA